MRFSALLLGVLLVATSLTGSLGQGPGTDNAGNGSYQTMDTGDNDTSELYTFPFDEHFQDYVSYGGLRTHLFSLESNNPEIAKVYIPGQSWYDRDIMVLKISDGVDEETDYYNDPEEEDIVIIGMFHSNEWTSMTTPLYFAYFLTHFYNSPSIDNDGDGLLNEDEIDGFDNDGDGEDNDNDPTTPARFDGTDNDGDGLIDEGIDEDPDEGRISYLVDNREIWILPMLNPDGYEYDRSIYEPGDNQYGWRKNQRDNDEDGEFDPQVDGVDMNRNFPYEWNHNEDAGTVDEDGIEWTYDDRVPASLTYHGPDDDRDNDGDAVQTWDPIGNKWVQTGVDEDPVDGMDDDNDGLVDEDKDGGASEPAVQAVEYLFHKLDIYHEDTQVPPRAGDYRPENFDGKSNLVATISYHNQGEWVIWPWGYTSDPMVHQELHESVGYELMDMTGYKDWRAASNYQTSGGYMDWTYGSHGLLSFTLEVARPEHGSDDPDEGRGNHAYRYMIQPLSRHMLAPNMHITQEADRIKLGMELVSHTLEDVKVPVITHMEPHQEFYEDDKYEVYATIENQQNVVQDSIYLNYRVTRDGRQSAWKSIKMHEKLVEQEFYYFAKIPEVEAPATVDYYISLQDVRGINVESGNGPHGSYSYSVDAVIGFGNGVVDFFAVAIMMVIMYGAVWGGLYYFVGVAAEADRRKLEMYEDVD